LAAFAAGLRRFATGTILIGGLCALVGFLVVHFTGSARAAQGAGWGMCVGGASIALVVGQSGSPTRMSADARLAPFGFYWGRFAAMPQSPLWSLASSLIVFAGGIALVVLTY
jgi:hypothetical protein